MQTKGGEMIQDSGVRTRYESGMVRDTTEGKIKPALMLPVGLEDDFLALFNSIESSWYREKRDVGVGVSEILADRKEIENDPDVVCPWLIANMIKYAGISFNEMMLRLARQYTDGALKYGERNWEKAGNDIEAYNRVWESAYRHWFLFMLGNSEEDHLAASIFNILAIYFILEKKSENE